MRGQSRIGARPGGEKFCHKMRGEGGIGARPDGKRFVIR